MKRTLAKARDKHLKTNTFYHIIQRAPGNELLFIEEDDWKHMLHLMKEMCQKFGFTIASFCLMPNHLHILGKTNKDNFPEAMHFLFQKYALRHNKKYKRKGHVFYGRYRTVELRGHKNLLVRISAYIHENPVRAGLSQTALNWKWSSIKLFKNPNTKSFVNIKPVLRVLSINLETASSIYIKIINELDKKIIRNVSEIDIPSLQDFETKYFHIMVEILKSSIMQEEYIILSNLKNVTESSISKQLKSKAKLQALRELLDMGYDESFLKKYLNISSTAFYSWKKLNQ